MPPDLSITVIICTHNNPTGLRRTLDTLAKCKIPPGWHVEVLIVDNASTDGTEPVIRTTVLKNIELQYLYEPTKGLSYARNSGLAHARGEVILFTDDDVLVAENWIEQLASPVLLGNCDAATGRITIAPHLDRTWMTAAHREWLASSLEAGVPGNPGSLVGASMGFRRSVLEQVPAFDPELGSGAIGSGEDTLFGLQLVEAGYRVAFSPNARAVHCFDVERLKRRRWLDCAVRRGRTEGYILYHWEHGTIHNIVQEIVSYRTLLKLRRIIQPPPSLQEEGCPAWEMSYVANIERLRQYLTESRRLRVYEYHGLRRSEFPVPGSQPLSGHRPIKIRRDP